MLLVLVGATAGAGVVFIAARTAFADLARRRAGPFMARLEDGFSRNAFSYLLALRLIPAAPFWVVNIVPALTRMPFRSYLAATFIGIAPGSAVFVSVGRVSTMFWRRGARPISKFWDHRPYSARWRRWACWR